MAAKKGFTGAKVVEVQRRLKLLNYEIGDSQIDGILGPQTKEALKKFQQDRGLDASGIVDEETWMEILDAGYHYRRKASIS